MVVSTDTARFIYDSWGTLQGFILNDSETYLYVKNLQGDIIAIVDEKGQTIVEYSYDAWGQVTFHETSLQNMTKASTLCFVSPFTYRGYCYDYDIELYYLQSRYYSPEIGRFINADSTDYLGTTKTVLSYNLFAYCENNPIINVDYRGYALETILDIAGIGWSIYELAKAPSWINLGYLVWDVASAFIPFVPGSYTVKGGKVVLKVASKINDFKSTKYLTTGTYKSLKKLFKGIKGIEVHHIIEKRFVSIFKKCKNADAFLSIPLDKDLHKIITKRWRQAIPYGTKYKNITYTQMKNAINYVYSDMPELKKTALKWFQQNWKK